MADDPNPAAGKKSDSAPDPDATAGDHESVVAEPDASAAEDASEAGDVAEVEDYDAETADDAAASEDDAAAPAPAKPRMSHVRLATIAGLVLVLALGGLTGWLGFRAYQSHQAEEQRNLFLQVGRQGALNLTTINHETADEDVQRILDSATGTFYDDFQQRAQPFVEVVKQAQSKSEGKVTAAGVESETENGAEVLVAVTVNTTNAGAPEQQPRSWRMRITVQEVEDEAKVSNVEFVP